MSPNELLLNIFAFLLLFANSQSKIHFLSDDDLLFESEESKHFESVFNLLDVEDTGGQITNDRTQLIGPNYDRKYDTIYTHPLIDIPGALEYHDSLDLENRFTTYKAKRRPDSRNKEISANAHRKVKHISRFQSMYFPNSNVVRLSTGCTGTLLTPYHVITAAHCVHNGNRYKRNIDMLKIEVPELIGSRLFYVMELNVPVMWKKTQTFPEAVRGAYDYAILKLNLPVRGRNTFMHLGVPDIETLNSELSFVTFSSIRHNSLIQSLCHPDENLLVMNGNGLLSSCESAGRGTSGSALFVKNGRENADIIGILSNTIKTLSGEREFDAIMLMTERKSADICSMIYPEGNLYNVCDETLITMSSPEDARYKTFKTFG